jgi:type VI secretion system protein ImpC
MALAPESIGLLPQDEQTLPFKCLIMAPLLALRDIRGLMAPTAISLNSFDEVMARLSPTLSLEIDSAFLCRVLGVEKQTLTVDYQFNQRDDFSPINVIARDPGLCQLSDIINSLKVRLQAEADDYTLEGMNTAGLSIPVLQAPSISRVEAEFVVCELEEELSLVLNQILHDPGWQKLESAWRGLYWLCESSHDLNTCQIDIMPVSREVLWEDLMASSAVEDSQLYTMLYSNHYGQYGGIPYGAILLDDYFSSVGQDIELLRQLARLASVAQLPVSTGAGPGMFGVTDFADLAGSDALTELHQGARYIKWRSFLGTAESSYLSMTLPRIQIRPPYGSNGSKMHTQGNLDWYKEYIAEDNEHCLWANAGYAFIINLMKSFASHGFCSSISGLDDGNIDFSLISSAAKYMPVEYVLSEAREAEIINLGFNPIGVRHQAFRLIFQSASSVRWGAVYLEHRNQTVDSLASAQLQYMMIVLRVVHCLKILFREKIGSLENSESLAEALNRWLRQYVSDVETPSRALRARRPLRDGKIGVLAGREPGWYDISVSLRPHLKYLGEGIEIDISVPVSEVDN